MAQYRKKSIINDPLTFEEFHVLMEEEKKRILNGEANHLSFNGHHIISVDDGYLIPTLEGQMSFTPSDLLITGIKGEIYLYTKDIFDLSYEKIERPENMVSFSVELKMDKTGEGTDINLTECVTSGTVGEVQKMLAKDLRESFGQSLKLCSEDVNSRAGLSFSAALIALKEGRRISRAQWTGLQTGSFIFRQIPATIPHENIEKMQSLPEMVKAELIKRGDTIQYQDQIAMVHLDSTIVGWAAKPDDILANDWIILD